MWYFNDLHAEDWIQLGLRTFIPILWHHLQRPEDGPLSRQYIARWQRIHALPDMKDPNFVRRCMKICKAACFSEWWFGLWILLVWRNPFSDFKMFKLVLSCFVGNGWCVYAMASQSWLSGAGLCLTWCLWRLPKEPLQSWLPFGCDFQLHPSDSGCSPPWHWGKITKDGVHRGQFGECLWTCSTSGKDGTGLCFV